MARLKNDDVVILAAKRSPIGKFGGALKDWSAPQIAGPVIRQVVRDAKVDPKQVDRLIMGHVLSAGGRQGPAKQAAFEGGLPESCRAHSVDQVCASSLQALWGASHFAKEEGEIVVAGGMESMSQSKYLLARQENLKPGTISFSEMNRLLASTRFKMGFPPYPDLYDSMIHDGLTDAYGEGNPHMGELADQLACSLPKFLSREQQDRYAFESHFRALKSRELGPDTLGISSGYPIEFDEGVREPNLEKLSGLKAIFGKTITAGNASQLSDGAAALMVATYKKAKELGIAPLARIVAFADHSQEPAMYTTAPTAAANAVWLKSGLPVIDLDLTEVNEAFAVVPLFYMMCQVTWSRKIFHSSLNKWGGAIAMGHPIGASGVRIVVTLSHALRHTGGRYGLAVACHGGGGAVAVIIENLQR